MTTSSSGGLLVPLYGVGYVAQGYFSPHYAFGSDDQLEDDALLDFLQEWIVGLSTIPATNVRPRWQPEPTNIPAENVNWVAFGISKRVADTFAAELHKDTAGGYNELRRHEALTIACSFYGPNCNTFARRLREGMQVAQNREILTINNMGLIDSGDISPMPELIKEKWYMRVDFSFNVRRQLVSVYAVQNLGSAQFSLNNEKYIETVNVSNV